MHQGSVWLPSLFAFVVDAFTELAGGAKCATIC